MEEKWLPVKGYEGLYEVSDMGRVRSLKRATTSGKVLKPYVSPVNGYCYVTLSKDNKRVPKRVHKLIMMAFNPIDCKRGYDKDHTIDHIDGDKTNNALVNLEWCTQSENQKRAYALGINGKTQKAVINLDTLQVFESMTEAVRSVGGTKVSAITRVCRGQRSQYRNNRFAYLEDYENGTIPQFTGKAKESCEALWR